MWTSRIQTASQILDDEERGEKSNEPMNVNEHELRE